MTLAQKVREFRYAKGWGPDELASRADISRTALYQIESGKTELPRASTLRRIAIALEVPMDDLLDHETLAVFATSVYPSVPVPSSVPAMESSHVARRSSQALRTGTESSHSNGTPVSARLPQDVVDLPVRLHRAANSRQHELELKFLEVLESPLGESLARIIEESHRLLRSARAFS